MTKKLKVALGRVNEQAQSKEQRQALLTAVDMACEEYRDQGYQETANNLGTVHALLLLYEAGLVSATSEPRKGGDTNAA